jgi:hypothetical protein
MTCNLQFRSACTESEETPGLGPRHTLGRDTGAALHSIHGDRQSEGGDGVEQRQAWLLGPTVDLKPGARLRSSADATEVVVVRAPSGPVDLLCGGHPMQPIDADPAANSAIQDGFGGGTKLGKRYADEEVGIELLCTKGGEGSLSLGTTILNIKDAKSLPSSD